jgi:hypothetical protein
VYRLDGTVSGARAGRFNQGGCRGAIRCSTGRGRDRGPPLLPVAVGATSGWRRPGWGSGLWAGRRPASARHRSSRHRTTTAIGLVCRRVAPWPWLSATRCRPAAACP